MLPSLTKNLYSAQNTKFEDLKKPIFLFMYRDALGIPKIMVLTILEYISVNLASFFVKKLHYNPLLF
jgi:hypothetical protein